MKHSSREGTYSSFLNLPFTPIRVSAVCLSNAYFKSFLELHIPISDQLFKMCSISSKSIVLDPDPTCSKAVLHDLFHKQTLYLQERPMHLPMIVSLDGVLGQNLHQLFDFVISFFCAYILIPTHLSRLFSI